MKIMQAIAYFVGVSVLTFLVSVIVTLLMNVALHGVCTVDWDTSVRSALLFGIMFSWMELRRRKKG
jgi:hypothetical protein